MISPCDPSSAWTAKANKRVKFGYGLNYLIDVEHAVIVDVEPRPARTYDEVEVTKVMLDRTERCFGLKPKRLAADTAYGTGRFLGWLVGRGIAPHIPVRDASGRDDGTFSRRDFRWDKRRGVYICTNNKVLHTTGTVHDGSMLRYRASKFDRDACALNVAAQIYRIAGGIFLTSTLPENDKRNLLIVRKGLCLVTAQADGARRKAP